MSLNEALTGHETSEESAAIGQSSVEESGIAPSELRTASEDAADLEESGWVAEPKVQIVRGQAAILGMSDLLRRFADRCGQPEAMEDLAYFLSKPGFLKRTPHLMLINRGLELTESSLLGALLLYEYRVLRYGTGMFSTNDRSGRNTLVAPPQLRSRVAQFATQRLLDRGAHVAMITYRDDAVDRGEKEAVMPRKAVARWARRTREIAEYLPLRATFDATLAEVGQRTRSNMRYYRRRAEKELGCSFVPVIEVSREEFLAFNRECMFAVADTVAAWRYDSLKDLARPLLMGMRDKDGRWLSMVGGRRFNAGSELLWQMNRDGLPLYSLSLVMRSYFMEHEIKAGSGRFYIEGGTSHPIHLSFTKETLTDLTALRSSPVSFLVRKLTARVIPSDNELAKMFSDSTLVWRAMGNGVATAVPLP